jgi:hypothetical protein
VTDLGSAATFGYQRPRGCRQFVAIILVVLRA